MRRPVALVAAAALALAGLAVATSYLELALEVLFERSEIAFYGEVQAVTFEEREGVPWTVVTFEVLRAFRGVAIEATADLEAPPPTVELAFLGGQLPTGLTLTVNLMPSFEVAERVLVLAYDNPYASPIVGFRQGLWRQTELGFTDEDGRTLTLSDAGEPLRDGPGTDPGSLFEALATALGSEP